MPLPNSIKYPHILPVNAQDTLDLLKKEVWGDLQTFHKWTPTDERLDEIIGRKFNLSQFPIDAETEWEGGPADWSSYRRTMHYAYMEWIEELEEEREQESQA